MRVTPQSRHLMSIEEQDCYAQKAKDAWYKLMVREYGEDSPQAEEMKNFSVGIIKAMLFWDAEFP